MAFWNPTRRKIIKRLSQEPSYPSRLSKELGMGQALVAKHLEALEDVGVVTSSMESSPCGPRRREYLLSKSVSLTVDFAPHLFDAQVLSFNTLPEDGRIPDDASSLMNRIDALLEDSGRAVRFGTYSRLLADIDAKLGELQEQRAVLLFIRNYAMREAAKLVQAAEKTADEKRVIYHVLDEHSRDVQDISESLNLRESVVRKILADLKDVL
jgi:predicted transcriptional regulator